ncbi:hypothetical protein [Pseudonocardia sp. NPDC049635]|uniref:hypothetical protein n=1 Tax=Pseudonocardia sp. NPDC049635 TaxID=3155506 RepID=UPI0033FCAB58
MAVRAVPGTRIANPATREIVCAPPEGADVIRDKLSAWERFVHADDDLDPLVRMAVCHYQFGAIHPPSLTRRHRPQERLLPAPASRDSGRRLDRVGALHARRRPRVRSVDDTKDRSHPHVSGGHRRACSCCHPGGRDAQFLAVLSEQPYCRINVVAVRCDVSRQTASSWLHALVEAGLLRDVKVGREVLFVNHQFLSAVTRPE